LLDVEKASASGFTEVVEADDVLVRDLAGGAQLVVELRELVRVGADPLGKELEGDRVIECEVVSAVDLAHPAPAQQRNETIAAGDNGARREAARAGRPRGKRGVRRARRPASAIA